MLCAAIPYRRTLAGDIEVLLVTSRGKGNWSLPKGKVKPGKTAAISAQEEVYEEAGAQGTIDQPLVTRCEFPLIESGEGMAIEHMQIFSLEVEALLPTWPEMFQRQRRWVILEEAAKAVKGAHFRSALRKFASIMASIA